MRQLSLLSSMLSSAATRSLCAPAFLLVDFDGTCTIEETTPLLPHLAASLGPSDLAASKLERFAQLEKEYLAGLADISQALDLNGSPYEGFDSDGLTACLQAMDHHSSEVTLRVGESACLAGIRDDDVTTTLAQWRDRTQDAPIIPSPLRPGCVDTLASLADKGVALGVLSVNWCPALIHSILGEELRKPYEIWCNELLYDGTIHLHVPGAAEKRERVTELLKRTEGKGSVVYIGDSATDLLALLEADVGIIIGESRSVRSIARKFGVELQPLPQSLIELATNTIFVASSWKEIHTCLEQAMLCDQHEPTRE